MPFELPAPPEGVEAQLFVLACYVCAAVSALSGALLAFVRRGTAGLLTRALSAATALGSGAAVVTAAATLVGLPASPYGPDAPTVVALAAAALTASAVLFSWTAAEPRVAAIASAAVGLTGVGLLVQLLLFAASPDPRAAVAWELRRLSTFGVFAGVQAALVAAVGYAVSIRDVRVARALHGVAALGGVVAAAAALSLVGGGTWKEAAPMALALALAGGWLAWLGLRAEPPAPRLRLATDIDAADRVARAVLSSRAAVRAVASRVAGALRRAPDRSEAVLAFALVPIALANLALAFATGDTARDAARVQLGGLAFTPALLVPFAFAPALGLVLGCRSLRGRGAWALGLSLCVVGLLVAQKEIGYTGVVLGVAAVAFLTARGTLVHLLVAGGLGTVGVALAFELQPVLPWIPFTVRERVLLWLGGAGLFRRGGHLLAADRVTYDLGGVWGLGVDAQPALDLHATVNSLDTDFPLAVVGLFGGLPWLLATIGLFVAFAVALYDVTRRQARHGSAGSGWRLPTLAALATVPVASTVINISGGLTHLTPFAGVPAAFVSYGSFFLSGLLAVLVLFLVTGSEQALAAVWHAAAAREDAPERSTVEAIPLLERPDPPDPWWRRVDPHGLRLAARRLVGRLRLASVDAGVGFLVLALAGTALLWSRALHARYTDRPAVITHPALTSTVRVRPLAPGFWEASGTPSFDGILRQDAVYRLDALELRHRGGELQLVGACFDRATVAGRGIRVGFEGLMRPRIPGLEGAGGGLARELGARTVPEANDLVLPLPPVWLRHLDVHLDPENEALRLRAATPGARFVLHDEAGTQITRPRGGEVAVPAGWTVALADDPALHFRLDVDDAEVCLRATRAPTLTWPLSRWRDTLVGGPRLLRRAPVSRTVDFEFAEDLKRASEARIVGVEDDGRLWVIPFDRDARRGWDPLTRKRFRRVFRIRPGPPETLHWVRGFYRDGSSRVRFEADPEAFAADWQGDLLGLRDPFRFSRALPSTASPDVRAEVGSLLDRDGTAVATLTDDGRRWEVDLPGAGALVGWGFPKRGLFGGLLRNFRRLLMGRTVTRQGVDAELGERILGRDAVRIGADVYLTLDRRLQRLAAEVVADECDAMRRLALDRADLEWTPRGRALVLGPEGEILAAASCPAFAAASPEEVVAITDEQRRRPAAAPGLDAWHRTTTVGSTAKVGIVVAAAQRPSEHFAPHGRDDLCVRAEDDPENASRDGCFRERGALNAFRGEVIAPVRNFGGAYFGGTVSVREMLVRSMNTAASYIAGRLGLDGVRGFYATLGFDRPYDLLPDVLGLDPRFASDIERYPLDTLSARRARIGEVADDAGPWRATYDVRLGLSGFSDFSLLHVGAAAAIAARDGRHYQPYLVAGIRDLVDGQLVAVTPPHPLQVIPVRVARYIKRAMVETVARGTAQSLRRQLSREVWTEAGGKTGTGETVRLEPGAEEDETKRRRRKPRTQDHKFFVGFWPASSRNPYVIVTGFEHVSHLDTKVALRAFGRLVEGLLEAEDE